MHEPVGVVSHDSVIQYEAKEESIPYYVELKPPDQRTATIPPEQSMQNTNKLKIKIKGNHRKHIWSPLCCSIEVTSTARSTLGAKVALESSWGRAFTLADPSNIEGSSFINSLDPA